VSGTVNPSILIRAAAWCAAALFAATASQAQTIRVAPTQQTAAATQSNAVAPATAVAAAPAAPIDYVLGAGDVVKVTVFQNPDLSLETRISESGAIGYPLLGQVQLGGLTVARAEKAIADGLREGKYVRQPQVAVLVVQVRGNQVSALGFVNRPGRYPLDVTGMRVSELLALAGGIAANGSDVVTLTGSRNGQPSRQQIDVPSLFGPGAAVNDPVLQHGDVLYVDRMPMIYVYGEVQRPGALRLERGMTVRQGLAAGGGLNQRGTARGLKVHRRDDAGKVQIMEPRLDDVLRDGDVVYVRESLF
jgi:polysaccharide export outer membrane protein